MIQLSDIPEDVHRKLELRAAEAGLSLSEFLIREFEKIAAQTSQQEFLKRLGNRPVRHISPSPTEIIREERDIRSRESFQSEYREAIEAHNRFIDENGIWSESFRNW